MTLQMAVVTPSFNQGCFIERTLQSVLTQSILPSAYYVMDGGSTDETVSILERYNDRIQWVSERDDGQAHAVNKGLKKISADIIGWLNSDDVYYPDTIKTVLDFFENHPDVDVLYGDAMWIDPSDREISLYPTELWNIQRLLKTCYLAQPAVFFRGRVIMQQGLLDERLHFCMDYEYWLRLALKGVSFAYLPRVLAGSRVYPETKTLRAPLSVSIETITMLREKCGYVPSTWLIHHAVLQTKQTTSFRFPEWRFGAAVLWRSFKLFFGWNSVLRAVCMSLSIPKTALQLRRRK